MLAIKLSQTGKTNKKMFRLVISEKGRDPYGNVLEILGAYNPHSKELVVKADRVNYWLSKGAQMTATVNNLLIEKNIVEGKKTSASKAGQTSEKRQNQIKAKAEKQKAAQSPEVSETPSEEVVETPSEEVVEAPSESTEASE